MIIWTQEKVPVASGSGGVGKGTGVSLSKEEQLVLQIIAEAGTSSIWNRDIRTKSNLSIIQVMKLKYVNTDLNWS